jgi:hypothetical protein
MVRRLLVICVGVIAAALALPAAPTFATVCRDGTISRSTGRGTCSHHGGIAGGDTSGGGGSGAVSVGSDSTEGGNPLFYVPPGHRPLVDYHTYYTWVVFRSFWKYNGGLEVFGYAKTPEYINPDNYLWTQIFERNRLEYHSENRYPYDVQLGLLGEERLLQLGRVWQNEPKATAQPKCRFFSETGHNLCEPFLSYWRAHGLEFDGKRGFSEAESLALFGYPISESTMEIGTDGVSRPTQWFQRARFEDHGADGGVLLGLLGNEVYGQQ